MKYTFVGDIHGKIDQVERALEEDGHIVFVGDYMDSHDRSPDDHYECLSKIIDAVLDGKATALLGNHEMSYLHPWGMCSGWKPEHNAIMKAMWPEMKDIFKYFTVISGTLVTHAGLTYQIWHDYNLSLDTYEATLNEWCEKESGTPAQWIGHSRGGTKPCGGIYWCDFNNEFEPIDCLPQIFGHTRGQTIRKKDNSYCIDCLDFKKEFLTLEL